MGITNEHGFLLGVLKAWWIEMIVKSYEYTRNH